MRFKARYLMVAALIGAVAAISTMAFAESPHFIGTPTCSKSSSGVLTCSGKAAGLGNGPTAAFLTASSVIANYECVNHGGNVAPGQPVVEQDVTGPSQTITPRNGQITFSPSLSPPTPPSAATECPNANWAVRLTAITYNDVTLHIQQPPGTDVLTYSFGNIDP
jgi:hypothetical protein